VVNLAKGQITVTGRAAEKLKASIKAKTTDTDTAFRVTRSPTIPTQLRMLLDKQRPGDLTVLSQGSKICSSVRKQATCLTEW
jgi:hypothetical protein